MSENKLWAPIFVFLILVWSCNFAQSKKDFSAWQGSYILTKTIKGNDQPVIIDTIIIAKAPDANKDKLAFKQGLDTRRLYIISQKSSDTVLGKPFLYRPDEGYNEYEEFGWTKMYLQDKLAAIDGGHFFICSTVPGTTIPLGGKEKFYTKTGMFMVMLHYGVIELNKIK